MQTRHWCAILVVTSLLLGGCSSTEGGSTSPPSGKGSQSAQLMPGTKADERRRQHQAQQRCMEQALNESRTGAVRCG